MTALKDIFTLLARLVLGIVLIAHGWQKYDKTTISGVQGTFENVGTPVPEISAQLATYFELVGGGLLILGLLVRILGPILFVHMLGAFWYVHRESGIFVTDGGWELVGVIGAAGLALSASGAGRISLDHLLVAPFRRRKEKKELADAYAAPAGAANAGAGTGAAGVAGMGAAVPQNTGATYSAPQATPGVNPHSAPAPINPETSSSVNYTSAPEDAATTQFNAPSGNNAGNRGNTNTTNNVDPDSPTTQWPGSPDKK